MARSCCGACMSHSTPRTGRGCRARPIDRRSRAATSWPVGALAEVVDSRASGFSLGDLVFADTGWQEFAALPARHLAKLPRIEPLTHLLSVYWRDRSDRLFRAARVWQAGSGEKRSWCPPPPAPVGSIVGQIAKIKGAHVIGVAGGAAKCALLTTELGFDGAVDYKAGDTRRALRAACPNGIDVYFDNVGGDILEACLFNMNLHGRIACCGAVSQYDGAAPSHGPRGVPGLIVTKRLTLTGFVVMDFYERQAQGPRRPEVVGGLRRLAGARGCHRRPRKPAGRADRPAGRRQHRQENGQNLKKVLQQKYRLEGFSLMRVKRAPGLSRTRATTVGGALRDVRATRRLATAALRTNGRSRPFRAMAAPPFRGNKIHAGYAGINFRSRSALASERRTRRSVASSSE